MSQEVLNPINDQFEGDGGLKIIFRSWHPFANPSVVVVIVRGFNSHSG
ncbi:hypothetical protein [Mesorhizobium sp. M0488]